MSASKRRPDDPFLPPGAAAPTPELAERPPRTTPSLEITPPPVAPPRARQPLRYRKPATSWVTVVILAFAAVGVAAVGGNLMKKVLGTAGPSPVEQAAKVISYSALSKDDAVLVTVQVSPRDARLMLDGEPILSNPLRLLRSKAPHTVSVSAPGYRPATKEVVPDGHKTLRFALEKDR
jgi:hypothetical protein